MKKQWIFIGTALAVLAVPLLWALYSPARVSQPSGTPASLILSVSTPASPLPPQETALDISTELSPLPVRVCAGDGVRFRNRHTAPVILTASDFSFSSGVLRPGEEFPALFPVPGTVEVAISSLDGSRIVEPYPIEVVRCGE